MSSRMKSKNDTSEPSAGQKGRTASNAARTEAIELAWRFRVCSRSHITLDAYNVAAIWATRGLRILALRPLVARTPRSNIESTNVLGVVYRIMGAFGEKPLIMQLL